MEKWKSTLRFYCFPFILWPMFLLIFIVLIPLIIIIYVIRTTEYLIYRAFYGARLMQYADVVWTMSTPQNDLTINCCMVVDDDLSINTFRTLINETLINSKSERGERLYWKTTKQIYPGYINYYWVEDEQFDIKNHVYELVSRKKAPTSKDELTKLISLHRSSSSRVKDDLSPWEFVLIPYVQENKQHTVILCRLSHAIADGSALAYFLINRLAQYQYPSKEELMLKYSQTANGMSRVDKFLLTLKGVWTLPVVQLDFLLSPIDDNMLHLKPGVNVSGQKKLTWTEPVDLALVKSIKDKLHTTVNDVLLGCLSKSLSDYFAEMKVVPPSDVTVIFPFDVRSAPDEAKLFQNKVAIVMLRLPTSSNDLLTTIKVVKRRIDQLKRSAEPLGSYICWKLVSFLLPKFISKTFVFSTIDKSTGPLSNLAGPQKTMTIGGHKLELITFWPPLTNNQSFGTSFCSYDGFISMAVEMDHCLAKDPRRLCKIFEENIEKLKYITNDSFSA